MLTIRHNHGRDYEENRNDNHSSIEKTVIQWKISWSRNSEDWKKGTYLVKAKHVKPITIRTSTVMERD